MSKRAVLMMTFGSPEEITYEGVAEFFTNIRRGVRPEPHEIQTLYDHYLRIGGTPLQRITKKEVDLVASALGEQVSVNFANKFSRPFIIDAIKEMENDGIEECLCLILEPHYIQIYTLHLAIFVYLFFCFGMYYAFSCYTMSL